MPTTNLTPTKLTAVADAGTIQPDARIYIKQTVGGVLNIFTATPSEILTAFSGATGSRADFAIEYTYDAATAAGAADGTLRLNANYLTATALYLAEKDVDGIDRSAILSQIVPGNLLQVTDKTTGTKAVFSLSAIVDSGTYRTYTVAFVLGQLTLTTAGAVSFQWLPTSGISLSDVANAGYITQTQGDARYPLKTATDPYPIYLTQAEAAALFTPIGGDAQGGLRYNFNTSTTFPTVAGGVRLNSSTLSSVTQINVNESDRNSANMSVILDAITAGTRIQIAFEDNEEIYAWFRATAAPTDNGSDRTIPVAFVASAGSLAAGEVTINLLQIQGSSGHIIQDEGTSLTARSKINFVGDGIAATDDATNDATVVTVTATSSGEGGASGLSAGSISATPSDSQVQLTEVTPPSGSTFPPYTFQWLQNTSMALVYPGDVVAGQAANNYTATGLANGSTYYFRRVAIDQLGNKVSTPVIFASPASVAFDSDAITYFNAITSTGVTLTTTQKTNANAVFVGLKTNISAKWNKIKGLYLFLGGTAAAHAINAKLPGTNNLVFSGTSVHNAQGWQPDGSSGYAETGISPSSLTAQRGLLSFSVSGYGSTNPGFTAGAIQGTNRFYAGSISSTELFDALYVTAEQAYILGTAKSLGSFAFNRSADANYTIAIDGSVVVTRTATADTGTINNTVIIGATKNASNTPQYFESALYSMFTIGLNGLTNTEISELASLEESYRTSR